MSFWSAHKTKIAGALTTAAGLVGAINPEVLSAVSPKAASALAAAGGLLTLLIGCYNTVSQPVPPVIR